MILPAQEYINEGFSALPLDDNKRPMLPEGHPYLYQIMREQDIDKLFSKAEKIGVACGEVSDGFYCLDFDAHKGENIRLIFNEFMRNDAVKEIMTSCNLPVFRTPSGGYHVYFRCDDRKMPGHYISKWESGEVMIEVRGHGQYVCTAPSKGYKKLAGSDIIEVSRISVEDRDTLFAAAEAYNQFIKPPETEKKGSGSWPLHFDETKPIGRYNENEAEHAKGLLIDAGWQHVKTRHDGVELWLRPGKEQSNGSTVHSATFGKYHNMFYVYSSSDKVFREWTAYSPFDILLKLQFAGDFSAAKSYLEDRYREKPVVIPAPEQIEEEPEEIDIPNFPLDVLPGDVHNFITQLNSTLNYSTDFLALAAMFSVSTCNGNKVKLRVKNGWIAPSIFWFAVVGEPGTMKSHPVGLMIKPIHEIDKASKKIYDGEMSDWMAIDKDHRPRKPRFRQMLISDYTLEALHDVHDFNKRGIGLYKDELVGFLNDMNKYRKGSDEQFWLESFNNKSYIVNRVTKEPIFIDDININIIGTIQPSVLSHIVKDFSGNGLVDRFLYSRAEKEIYPLPRLDINPAWITWWNEVITNADKFYRYTDKLDTVLLEMSTAAMDRFFECDMALIGMQKSEGITLNMKGYLNKMKTYLPRFALLMALFDMTFEGLATQVEESHMDRAWKVIQYFIESAKLVFNEAETTMEISQVASSMFGMTKKEKIIKLHQKGYRNSEISKELNTTKQFVYKAIAETKKDY